MTTDVLETRDLRKSFKSFKAINGVNLTVKAGSIHAVIGPNGAGKSTLFKLITGVHSPSGGDIILRGESVGGRSPHAVARKGLVQVFQLTSIFPRLNVFDSVMVAMISKRRRPADVSGRFRRSLGPDISALLESVGIAHLAERTAGELSHGDQRALELAMALATEPTVLLLDEPTAGMSPAETAAIAKLVVAQARARGITVLLSEHDMEVIFGISEHITVLHQGRVIADGTPDEIRKVPEVMAVYLGEEPTGEVAVGKGPLPRRGTRAQHSVGIDQGSHPTEQEA